ncbi:MAG: riboflavin biosynthesis protein ribA [Chloroflexi bacterium]|jgi:3,4-dihydroxy 2-butanone 4-phosphate synthase/GTP cyclohydrolase II|nr:riboflavin biosynthesis protein ribA [Chloroflexota bacterium]
MEFANVEKALEEIRAGRMVLVTDNTDRENEGDLILAAEKVTPEAINFMAKYARGLICLSLTGERLDQLGIPLIVDPAGNGTRHGTAFTVPIEATEGITTGISAADRATTIRVAVDPASTMSSLARPGHVFPLRAKAGGVLERPGHTEAAIDLARLAGLSPAGVICEVMNPDGTMARRPELVKFARKHKIILLSIEELIAYRQAHEETQPVVADQAAETRPAITFLTEALLPTSSGKFKARVYREDATGQEVMVLLNQDYPASPANPEGDGPLVRVHSECMTGDVFGSQRCDCGPQLQKALDLIAADGYGVVIYLRQEGRGIGLAAKIAAYALQDKGYDTVEANIRLGFSPDLRDYRLAAAVLAELGVKKLRLLTNNPAKVEGLEEHGLTVARRLPLQVDSNVHNLPYLHTKRNRMRHILELEPEETTGAWDDNLPAETDAPLVNSR